MVHKYLKFNDTTDARWSSMLERIHKHKLLEQKTICYDFLEQVGQRERALELLSPPWVRLFNIKRHQYSEMVLEFYSTFTFSYPCQDLYQEGTVRFRLGGVWRSLSVAQFGIAAGLYTEAEASSSVFTRGLHEFEDDQQKYTFWQNIGVETYNARTTKSTQIRDPLHRYLHRVIASSISPRHESTGAVTLKDLFFLYCMITGKNCNLAHCLLHMFTRCQGNRQSVWLVGGSFISELASHFRVKKSSCTKMVPVQPLDLSACKKLGIVNKVGPAIMIDRWNRFWDPECPGPDPSEEEATNEEVTTMERDEFSISDVEIEEPEDGAGPSNSAGLQGDWDHYFPGFPQQNPPHWEYQPQHEEYVNPLPEDIPMAPQPGYSDVMHRMDQLQLHVDTRFDELRGEFDSFRQEQSGYFSRLFDIFGSSSSMPRGRQYDPAYDAPRSPPPQTFLPPPNP